MKANTSALLRKGYTTGVLSGMTWGLDTVLIGVAMAMSPFVENPVLLIGGTFICSMLHDAFAALWMLVIMSCKGRLKDLLPAIKSKDGLYCALGALFGGPLAMTFYMIAIAKGGAALTATVTACYPLLGSAMAMVILKEKVRLRGWLGLLICILGIIYIGYTPESETNVNVVGGIMLAAVAAIGWATEGVVCGYGMKAGNVDPQMALLIRELTSGIVYILIVAPIMVGGYGDGHDGRVLGYGLLADLVLHSLNRNDFLLLLVHCHRPDWCGEGTLPECDLFLLGGGVHLHYCGQHLVCQYHRGFHHGGGWSRRGNLGF